MSLAKAAFSLPGIAGIILTFGMAVDANVLIFERIREELRAGKDLKASVRLGYEKALSSIVDGNVTNLIVCVVLGQLGTQEIRGFAITLGIGVCTTLFAALFVSRLLMAFITDVSQLKRMSMLPMAFPVIDKILEPKIKWISLRPLFMVVSAIFVGIGIFMVVVQGSKMLDMEFRGGVQVTLKFGNDEQGNPIFLDRAQVLDRVRAIGAGRGELDPLRAFSLAEATPVNPQAGGVSSDTFVIKAFLLEDQAVTSPTSIGASGGESIESPIDTMVRAIVAAFEDEIDTRSPVAFSGSQNDTIDGAPVYALLSSNLGEAIGRSEYRENVSPFIGGAAIVIEVDRSRVDQLPTLEGLEARLDTMRSKSDFADTLRHESRLVVLRGTADAVETVAYLVRDANLSFFDNEEVWRVALAQREWDLVRSALSDVTTLASVQTFSPVIAERFKQTAVVSVLMSFLLILIYIWVRFGSVRYSLAAIITLLHDVLIVIGLIALAEIAYDHGATAKIAQALGVAPFKIDLTLVAAILTIIGYSLNDTIIIMDRIRENRGKLPYASATVVNLSINQTISRTTITSGTTLLATVILYVWGGDGVRAFSYALLTGVIVGTYSSIAVAAPLVWSKKTGGSATSSS
jgi:SecD/SecF fusion protein